MVYLGAQVKRFPGNAQTTGSGAARFATKTVPTIEAYTQRLWIPNLALLGARRHQADNSADVWHPTSRADSEVSLGQGHGARLHSFQESGSKWLEQQRIP